MHNLSRKLGEVTYDNLVIPGIDPSTRTDGGVIRKGEKQELKRGTLLAKSNKDGLLVVLGTKAAEGETLEPYGILCDDITVGEEEDESCAIYTAGKFNSNSIIVANGYTITEADRDTLRKYSIILSASLS